MKEIFKFFSRGFLHSEKVWGFIFFTSILSVLSIALITLSFVFKEDTKTSYERVAVRFANVTVIADVAKTQDQKAKGLAGRVSLATEEGMLFPYDKADYHTFWMKGMKIPIDILWLRDGYVVDIAAYVQPPLNGERNLTIYKPKEPASEVLEVSAGFAEKYAITIGARYTFASL